MKKLLQFLRSMLFGLLLMGGILACSVIGSLLPQGEAAAYYVAEFPRLHATILALGLNDVFNGWFFLSLLAMLCMNLVLCSILRIRNVVRAERAAVGNAAAHSDPLPLSDGEAEALLGYLRVRGFRRIDHAGAAIYRKNRLGWYGSFVTHAAILLTLLASAAALYLPVTVDRVCMPGETLTLTDGTAVTVESFSIEDATGRLDYKSRIRVALPDGRGSADAEIRVNHPFRFGSYKFYQQTYGTAGAVTVHNETNGASDRFLLTEASFLSADGVNGLWFVALYPGYVRDEAGNFTLIESTAGAYRDPVYQVLVASDGVNTPVLAFPGETLRVGSLSYTMEEPVAYPGLRIKRTPDAVFPLLYASFALLLAGLWLCFFHAPVYVAVHAAGYAVSGPKPEETAIDIRMLLEEERI